MEHLDSIVLNFNKTSVHILNVTLALIMFGIALDLTLENFKVVLQKPKSVFAGMFAQLVLLPFLTFCVVLIFKPMPSFALGMILVAACPGGNISNFISSIAGANVELSIVLTIISSVAALICTPLNVSFYGSLYEPTNEILRTVNLNWLEVVITILSIIIIPITIGMLMKSKFPAIAKKLSPIFRVGSMIAFLVIVLLAILANGDHFVNAIGAIALIIFGHNALALATGFSVASIFRLPNRDRRSLTIETGIQNSGLGLLLIFTFFEGLGGMAIIAAGWGIWHILSGFAIAYLWGRRQV